MRAAGYLEPYWFGMACGSARLTPHPTPKLYDHVAPIKGLSRHKRGRLARIYSTVPLTEHLKCLAAKLQMSVRVHLICHRTSFVTIPEFGCPV